MPHKLFFFGLIGCLLLVSCDKSPSTQRTQKQKKATKEKQEQKMPLLNNKNVSEVLLAYGKENPETEATIHTNLGNIQVKLYEDTPIHRANFVMLTKRDFFENTQFYRVIEGFVVQGGDSDELIQRTKKRRVGKYSVPAEILPHRYHKRGAMAAARRYENNPEKNSTPWDFYFVVGPVYNRPMLQALAQEHGLSLNQEQQQLYTTVGGNPHLDGEHTVFGEVTAGMDVVEKIAQVEVGEGEWPIEKVFIEKVTLSAKQ